MFERLKARDAAAVQPFGNIEALHLEISERLADFSRAVSRVMMEAEMPRDTFVKLAREFIARRTRPYAGRRAALPPRRCQDPQTGRTGRKSTLS